MFDPLKVIALREANYNQGTFPPIRLSFPLASTEWTNLIDLIDLEAFQALDDRIGCPDCADGGAEWVQIDWKAGGKRVTFENGQQLKGLDEFIDKLRQMRKSYFDKF